ncbi:uncharacterized protein LOC130047608 [Ostrea edulis]|uniref:uncharacterized protein LOC130047608 n=1 Tax=Ostrea edulis TaxID=37623 RepID=UPI0024AE8C7D|nr:uncharacterized protein LOC130047608 [Ostrea edulis]
MFLFSSSVVTTLFRMKAAFLLLVCLPFMFAKTANEPDFVSLEAYNSMTPEERMSVHSAVEAIKHWFASHGTQLTAGACGVFCAAEAAATLGIGAPVCAAACALIGLIG